MRPLSCKSSKAKCSTLRCRCQNLGLADGQVGHQMEDPELARLPASVPSAFKPQKGTRSTKNSQWQHHPRRPRTAIFPFTAEGPMTSKESSSIFRLKRPELAHLLSSGRKKWPLSGFRMLGKHWDCKKAGPKGKTCPRHSKWTEVAPTPRKKPTVPAVPSSPSHSS